MVPYAAEPAGRHTCRWSVAGSAGLDRRADGQSSSRMRGTAKRPSSCSGAPDSASSGVSPGRTTSGRVTLVSGIGCDIGGAPSMGACWTLATDSRMTDELADHAVELGVREVDASQPGEVGDVGTGECGHGGQSMGRAVRSRPRLGPAGGGAEHGEHPTRDVECSLEPRDGWGQSRGRFGGR